MNEPFIHKLEPDMCSVDFTGCWQPGAVLRAMQDAGEGHCRLLHLTFPELRERGLAWVLTRAHLQMDEYPTLGHEITIKTWPGATRHTFFPRYFTFESEGRVRGCASVLYVLLDLETRKIASPARLASDIPTFDIPAPLPYPGSLKPIAAEETRSAYTPVYMDFDMNGHVNNTRYVDWYMNRLPYERHERELVSELLIHYHAEVKPGQALTLSLREAESVSAMQGACGDQLCFAIQGTWQNRR